MQNYEFSLEFNPDVIQHIYSLIKEDPDYVPRPYRGGMLPIEQALRSINDTRALRIGEGNIGQVAELFGKQFPGCEAIIVADTNTFSAAGSEVEESLKKANIPLQNHIVLETKNLKADYDTMNALLEKFKELPDSTIPVAVGSGTINDLTKLASHLAGKKYMCVPTAASMDGYTAYGATLLINGIKQQFPCSGPQAVLVDTDVLIKAPREMTESGFVNLMAKMTVGADWMISDWMGIELINEKAWRISQSGFHEALMLTEDAFQKNNDEKLKVRKLVEGLMLSGFATQVTKSNLPAAGTEHKLSEIWELERGMNNLPALPHGVLLSIAELATTALYNKLLSEPLENLNVTECVKSWPDVETYEKQAYLALSKVGLQDYGMQQAKANFVSQEQLSIQLQQLVEYWFELRDQLVQQILPLEEMKKRMKRIGLPIVPEKIGVSREHLRQTLECAPYLCKKFGIFSVAFRTGLLSKWLDEMFNNPQIWKI